MTARGLLIAARGIIAEPTAWCRGGFARDAGGRTCGITDAGARRFCLVGALELAASRLGREGAGVLLCAVKLLMQLAGTADLTTYNDSMGHAAMLTLIDRCIG